MEASRADGIAISILESRGDGTFDAPRDLTFELPGSGQGPTPITHTAAGDLNGDGYPDLVTANRGGGTMVVLLSAPQGCS